MVPIKPNKRLTSASSLYTNMNPINQCIVVLALMSFAFWIVDSASFEDAYKVCEQEVDQVYKNNTVADIFTNCMEEQLRKYYTSRTVLIPEKDSGSMFRVGQEACHTSMSVK